MNIVDNLWLGDMHNAHSDDFIRTNNIKKIINVTYDVENKYVDIKYLNIQIEDGKDSDIHLFFETIKNFISEDKTQNVLIHCRQGVSRSATLVIAYLMSNYDQNLLDAYNHVKSIRKIIQPNIWFFNKLIDLDKKLYGIESISIYKYMNKTPEEYEAFIRDII
jgi:predicted protein tyrosine phosphatase